MTNYCTVDEIKTELSIDNNDRDDVITTIIASVKTMIDNYCDRAFDTTSATRYYDGSESPLYIDDLVTLTTIKLDRDGDGTYETTLATTDYILYPLNSTPKTRIAVSNNGDYGDFASGILKGVEIAGTWGYAASVPDDVKRAAVIQSCRWLKRSESAYQDAVQNPVNGEVTLYKGLDGDVKLILNPYVKRSYL